MKNKCLFGTVAVLSIFALASCNNKSSDNYEYVRNDKDRQGEYRINPTIRTALKCPDNTGVKLDTEEKTSGTYYDVYVAADTVDSLFVYSYDLSDFFGSSLGRNNKSITATTLNFEKTTVYSSEQEELLASVFPKTTTGTKKNAVVNEVTDKSLLGKLSTVGFTVDTTTTYTKTLNTNKAFKAYSSSETVFFSVVYAPIYVEHYYNGNICLQANFLVPVYETFTTASGKEVTEDGLVDSTISTLPSLDLESYLSKTHGKLVEDLA